MKLSYRLVYYIMMALPWIQLHGQVDLSVYPSKPVFDTSRYEKVDENSRPALLSCKDGGYGLYQLNVSETFETDMEVIFDTIDLEDGKWTLDDMNEYQKEYNEAHQQELEALEKQDIDGYRDIQKVCEEVIKDLMNDNWNTDDFCLCELNCEKELESCYIKSEVLRIGKSNSGYRYETIGTSKLVRMDDENQLEIGIKTIQYYEATVYFKVICFCSDYNVMSQPVPSDEGGEYTALTATGPELTNTDSLSASMVPRTMQDNVTATGTGRTTGHIADLKIKNTTDTPINILPQSVYIPSGGQYQPYVAKIPGTTVPPNGIVIIPVPGYCADVHKPPVGSGDGMPPIDTWITTTPVPTPKPTGTDYPVVTNVVPPFTPQHIAEIVTTPGFTPNPPPKTTPVPTTIIPTWPGTDIPVNGTIDPVEYPETFAPVIIDALEKITVAFEKLKGEGTINTPFSGDPVKERESVIQQTFWIFTADITGEKYQKESFQEKVIDQFENSTGTTVATLPEPEKKKLDGGVDAFWNVFVATGVEAKIMGEIAGDQPKNDIPEKQEPKTKTEEKPDTCKSFPASFSVSIKLKSNKTVNDGIIDCHFVGDLVTECKPKSTWRGEEVKVKPNDEIIVTIKKFVPGCLYCKTAGCTVGTKQVQMDAVGTKNHKEKTVIAETKGEYQTSTLEVDAAESNTENKKVQIKFYTQWTCVGSPCIEASFSDTFTISVERAVEEKQKEDKKQEHTKDQTEKKEN